MTGTEYADRVRAWATQLRGGSTQTWTEFLATPAAPSETTHRDDPLPGVAQLELVRRLAPAGLPEFDQLADLILSTAGPGRGLLDAPLPWPRGTDTTIGTPPVAPEDVAADELLRVGAGALVRLLAAESREPVARPSRRWRPWQRGFTLLG